MTIARLRSTSRQTGLAGVRGLDGAVRLWRMQSLCDPFEVASGGVPGPHGVFIVRAMACDRN